jgi:hypothetical protein
MKRTLASFLILSTFFALALYGQNLERFSKNALPKLNVIGIALSEDASTAKTTIQDFYRKQMRLELQYPILADVSYKKLGEQKAFDISLFGKSTSGKKYYAAIDSLLDLNANPFTLLIIDRSKKIRAFSQGIIIDPRNASRVIEELLLNLDGKELITVDSGEPDMAEGWQTDLGKQNGEKKKKGFTLSIGPKRKLWYSQLGNEVPDVPLKTLDGTDAKLYDVLGGKVSVVFIWLASSQPDIAAVSAGTGVSLQFMDNVYHSFGLGEAKPGDEDVKNATPDPEPPKKN